MLTLSGITRRYGDATALDGLSFTVPDDAYVSLLGASGSGKTTLLRLIAGFEEPDAGQIILDGVRLDGQPPHRRDIGFVFQNFALFPHLTVEENVAFGLKYRESNAVASAAEVAERTQAALELVGLEGFGHRGVGEISGGQRQRVALARTLVTEPRIVLLDEPLGALDANLRDRMCDELRAIRERLKVSFLHVTGSETEALTMGDTVAVLAGGRIVQSSGSRALFEAPLNASAAKHLNAWNILSGTVEKDKLRTNAGILPVPGSLSDGQSAQIALRFDRIDVSDAAQVPEGRHHFEARFLTGEFNGPTALSFFRTADGALVQVVDHLSSPRLPRLEEGRTYALHYRPEEVLLFEGAEG
ncbi:putative spermidine/putrescine transport system ATP-binding protein [Poseidonocella pacifica]|uniref:Putative spermidine/putrescine transport system ATP-binding protein n=1 Tax=Poseidonocella pacifica TaxID=871651 RepID=A0A1I0X725_9RHOB|nr:putative spermidine/putrescine transport system ATP-binding protein [Poseidonocella pacifica]